MLSEPVKRLVELAIAEDLGSGDITTESIVNRGQLGRAYVIAREPLTVFGHEVSEEVFQRVNPALRYAVIIPDGGAAERGERIASVEGPLAGILSAERTALNFLQRLSGVSTLTRAFVCEVAGCGLQILDTRKTTPGYRELEKQAVKAGGGVNHRIGLFDAVLIKNNHIDAVGGDIVEAVRRTRASVPAGIRIQVEVRDDTELDQALRVKPDALLLDNMTPGEIARRVRRIRQAVGREIFIEASGGVRLDSVTEYCIDGLDAVSVGALTHSARAVDIALRIEQR